MCAYDCRWRGGGERGDVLQRSVAIGWRALWLAVRLHPFNLYVP